MIRRHAAAFQLLLALADTLMTLCVLLGASLVRFGTPWQGVAGIRSDVHPTLFVAVFAAGWVAMLWLSGAYELRQRWTFRARAVDVARATALFTAAALGALFLFKLTDVSRLYLLVLFPLLGLATLFVRVASRMAVLLLREFGLATRYMLVLGADRHADAFASMVEHHHELNIRVIGHLAGDEDLEASRTILGHLSDLEEVLHNRIVDEVAVCLPADEEDFVQYAVRLCEQEGKIVRIPAAPVERTYADATVEELDGLLIYSVVNSPDRMVGLAVKRLIDLVAAVVGLIVLAPVFAVIALLVKLDSKGPVFFRQERVGIHGRPFRLVKFRSMVEDAEELLAELQARNEIRGCAFKLENDPRITRIGRFLRKSSLDELPQLWNVLRGQMSLVGPRPPLPSEVAAYDVWHRRRLAMKPGITGLWQVKQRRDPEFDRWVQTDLEYIDGWSFWLDLKILLRTVPAVVLGHGR